MSTHSSSGTSRSTSIERIAEGGEFAAVTLHLHLQRFDLVDAVAERKVEFQTPRARHPRRTLFPRVASPDAGFGLGMLHALGPAHGSPVILVLGRAKQANLIIVPIRAAPRPALKSGSSSSMRTAVVTASRLEPPRSRIAKPASSASARLAWYSCVRSLAALSRGIAPAPRASSR